ncbi:U4 U6.U5 tri-snRNP-associated protein, partial [Coemansia sp. RSA 552]
MAAQKRPAVEDGARKAARVEDGARKAARVEDGARQSAAAAAAAAGEGDSEPTESCERVEDAYLDTIDRPSLDFDFEQVCSVSLSNNNVYACLVCGKYYQGRGKQTPAYFHSIHESHHIFINLETLKAYVLPDNYEIKSRSLNDIKEAIRPTYTPRHVAELGGQTTYSYDLNGTPYLAGFVGLDKIKNSSYINVVVQALAHIPPIRDTLLLLPTLNEQPVLLQRIASLVRKMWHNRLFKAHVSPHEFVQEAINRSKGRFGLGAEGDSFDFLVWMLNTLHRDLGGSQKRGSSAIFKAFQGKMRMTTQALESTEARMSEDDPLQFDTSKPLKTTTNPFLALSLDLPPKPLFTANSAADADGNDSDDGGRADIPQVLLTTLLQSYNGTKVIAANGQARQCQVLHLPQFVICHIKRFQRNALLPEKNPTVVNFPIDNVPFGNLLPGQTADKGSSSATYNLIANICHVGQQLPVTANASKAQPEPNQQDTTASYTSAEAGAGCSYVVYIRSTSNGKWYMLRDLQAEPVMPQMMFLSDSYIQIWQHN